MNEDFISPPNKIRRLAFGLASNVFARGEWQLLPLSYAMWGDNEIRPAESLEERAEMKERNGKIRECECAVATEACARRKSPASEERRRPAHASKNWKRNLMRRIQPGSLA